MRSAAWTRSPSLSTTEAGRPLVHTLVLVPPSHSQLETTARAAPLKLGQAV